MMDEYEALGELVSGPPSGTPGADPYADLGEIVSEAPPPQSAVAAPVDRGNMATASLGFGGQSVGSILPDIAKGGAKALERGVLAATQLGVEGAGLLGVPVGGAKQFIDRRLKENASLPVPDSFAAELGGFVGTAVPYAASPLRIAAGAGSALARGAGAALTSGIESSVLTPDGERLGAGVTGIAVGGLLPAAVQASNNRIVSLLAKRDQNLVQDATLRAARESGFKLLPAQSNPTVTNRILTGLAGDTKLAASASTKNSLPIQDSIRKQTGIPGTGQISTAQIDEALQPHLQVYGQARQLSRTADEAVEGWQAANSELRRLRPAQAQNNDYARQLRIDELERDAATYLDVIDNEAVSVGRSDFIPLLRSARVSLGRLGTVQQALNESTGLLDPAVLAARLRDGKPLDGAMAVVGGLGRAQRDAVQVADGALRSASPLDANGSLLTAGAAGAAGGAGLAAKVLASAGGLRPALRSVLLSETYQNAMALPNYSGNALQRALAKSDPNLLRAILVSGAQQ